MANDREIWYNVYMGKALRQQKAMQMERGNRCIAGSIPGN